MPEYFAHYSITYKDGKEEEFKDEICFAKLINNFRFNETKSVSLFIPILDNYDNISKHYYLKGDYIKELGYKFEYYIELLSQIYKIDCKKEIGEKTNQRFFPYFTYNNYYKVSFEIQDLTKGQVLFLLTCIRNGYDTYETYAKDYLDAFFKSIESGVSVINSVIISHYFMKYIDGFGHMIISDNDYLCYLGSFKKIKDSIHAEFNKDINIKYKERIKFDELIENKEYEKIVEYLSALS